jgi:hypothetical protein
VALHIAAEQRGIDRHVLARAIRAGRVPASAVIRPGTGSRYHVEFADVAQLQVPRCRCGRPALLPGSACGICALKLADDDAIARAGHVPIRVAAGHMGFTPEALKLGKVGIVRHAFGRRIRLGVDAREALRLSIDKDARRKLAKPLAARNGTERVGRPPVVLTDEEFALVETLRSEGRGWRKAMDELNERRPAGSQMSHVTVQQAFERQVRARAAAV